MPTISKVGTKRFRKDDDSGDDKSLVVFPDEPTEIISDLSDAALLLYGEKKIGKSSLCAQFPNAFFFMFDPRPKGLSVYCECFTKSEWTKFERWCKAWRKQSKFKLAIVDVTEKAYKACQRYVCRLNGWDHPADGGYGKGWDAVSQRFQDTMDLLLEAPGKGVLFVSHATERDFQGRDGDDYTKIVPNMPKGASDYVCGAVDLILYYGYRGTERLITVAGSQFVESNQRIGTHFWTADGTKRVKAVPAGDDEEEAYENLVRAWNNEQEGTGYVKKAEYSLSNTPAKKRDDRGRRK